MEKAHHAFSTNHSADLSFYTSNNNTFHLVALAVGVEFVHHAAKVGLAADDDFTLCKGDAEGIF